MPAPTEAEIAEFVEKCGQYRLGCSGGCLRDDYDGVRELPGDWADVHERQTLRDAMTTYDELGDPEPPIGYSVMDWETHLGVCPDCQ